MRVAIRTGSAKSLLAGLGSRLGLVESVQPASQPYADPVPEAAYDVPEEPQPQAAAAAASAGGFPFQELQQAVSFAPTPEVASPAPVPIYPPPEIPESAEPEAPWDLPYPVLARKKLAVVGFPILAREQLCETIHAHRAVAERLPWPAPASLGGFDLVLLSTPPEWAITEPIDAGVLAVLDRPAVVFGARSILTRLAQVSQRGHRDYIPPESYDEWPWRAAMLLLRPPLPRAVKERARPRENPSVVIADEDVTTRTLLSSVLARHGVECHPAENGSEALNLIRTLQPDAAIMDITMPALDGFQVLAAVRQDPNLRETTVMFLTSRAAEVDKLQAFALGACDYLTKPFSPLELAVRLKRLLRRDA